MPSGTIVRSVIAKSFRRKHRWVRTGVHADREHLRWIIEEFIEFDQQYPREGLRLSCDTAEQGYFVLFPRCTPSFVCSTTPRDGNSLRFFGSDPSRSDNPLFVGSAICRQLRQPCR